MNKLKGEMERSWCGMRLTGDTLFPEGTSELKSEHEVFTLKYKGSWRSIPAKEQCKGPEVGTQRMYSLLGRMTSVTRAGSGGKGGAPGGAVERNRNLLLASRKPCRF